VLFIECIDDHLADVAYHYNRSGNDAKAVRYLIRAGEQELQRSAFSLSASYFDDALARLNTLPAGAERDRKEIAIHTGLADIAIVASGYAAADYERHLMRRHELAERLGDAKQLFYTLVGISVLSAFRLELSKAQEIGGKLVALADQASDPEMQLEAHGSLANILWLIGDFIGSREHSEKGLALFARDEHLPSGKEHMRATCLFFASLCTAALGFPDEGLQQSLEFLTWARERAQPLPLVFALNCVATVFGWRREGAEELKYTDDLLTLTAEHGFSNWHSIGQIARGQALALLGKTDEAIAETKSALDAFEATGAAVPGWMYLTLAFAYLAAKQPAEGLRVVSKALQVADQTGDGEAKSEVHRLKGELLLMGDPTDTVEAEASFRAAIDAASKRDARLPELCATISLARLLDRQGKREEAHAMLAEIYGWFTEGFDTADLRDAKALLDKLSVKGGEC
jgi:tetratricopeptide (TPR) repeat protein